MSTLPCSRRWSMAAALVACIACVTPVHAAGPADPALMEQQRKALAPLARFDGHWRGEATAWLPNGETLKLVQTERVGPMLDGSVRVVEGRGYQAADGQLVFNALAVISYSPRSQSYTFRSYAQGHAGDWPLTITPDGFTWSINMGPNGTLRYTARIKDGTWHEVGERIVAGQPPVKTFEMTLRRIGDTDWPRGNAVGPK